MKMDISNTPDMLDFEDIEKKSSISPGSLTFTKKIPTPISSPTKKTPISGSLTPTKKIPTPLFSSTPVSDSSIF